MLSACVQIYWLWFCSFLMLCMVPCEFSVCIRSTHTERTNINTMWVKFVLRSCVSTNQKQKWLTEYGRMGRERESVWEKKFSISSIHIFVKRLMLVCYINFMYFVLNIMILLLLPLYCSPSFALFSSILTLFRFRSLWFYQVDFINLAEFFLSDK